MIHRLTLSEIKRSLRNFPVTGLAGPRQCGKTTIAKEVLKESRDKYIYLDLELTSDLNKLKDSEIFFLENKSKCIILDEVQRMPELFPLIRAVVDKNRRNGKFILLGSISPDVMVKQTSESLAGRIKYIEVSPFNLLEVDHKYDLKRHWLRGGFPLAFLSKSNADAFQWLDSFITTYIERDIGELGLQVNSRLMKQLWLILAHYNGNIVNTSEVARALGVTNKTVSGYLHFLEEAFIITLLQPYSTNTKKRLVKSPKIYIRDSGLLHALNGIHTFNDLVGNIVVGSSWEGYVIEQIKQLLPADYSMHYYRTQDGSEIDLVISKGNKVIHSIEIKFTKSPELRKGNILAMNDINAKKNIVTGYDVDTYKLNKSVTVTNVKELLKEFI